MISWHIQRFDEVTSTQDIATEQARQGAPAGTVIVAAVQTKGRGRSGNSWESLNGNLFCSLVLRPDIELAQSGQYSFLIAIALNRALSDIVDDSHSINNKWPNDVLVDEKKIAGILLEAVVDENAIDAMIVGIGVNIAYAPEDKIFLNALTIDAPESVDSFLSGLLAHLAEVLAEYEAEGFAALREEWLDQALNLHKPIKVRLPNAVLDGVFEGLEADGALTLRLANGDIKVIHSGEVFFG
jgi:BirA family biotin operon repressor/biotin-[acetyl-CoA-carboxylase] ligase